MVVPTVSFGMVLFTKAMDRQCAGLFLYLRLDGPCICIECSCTVESCADVGTPRGVWIDFRWLVDEHEDHGPSDAPRILFVDTALRIPMVT